MADLKNELDSLPKNVSASLLASGSSNSGTINNPKIYGIYIKIVNVVKEVAQHATQPPEKATVIPADELPHEEDLPRRNFFYERLFLRYYLFAEGTYLIIQLISDSNHLLLSLPISFIDSFFNILKGIRSYFNPEVIVLHDMPDGRIKDTNFGLNSSFLQRNDIFTATEQHLIDKNVAVYQATSGSGKSVAAMYFFHRMKESRRYNYLTWCDASSKVALDLCFCESYKALKVNTENNYEINIDCTNKSYQFAAFFSNWLNNAKYSWLLVLDDAQERPENHLNLSPVKKMLVTTQSTSWGKENNIQGFTSKTGQVLGFNDAKDLFIKTFNIECNNRPGPTDSEFLNFFDRIGTLPLVVVESANTICHEIVHGIGLEQPLGNYLEEYLVQPTNTLPSGDQHSIIHKVVEFTLKQLDGTLGHLESDPSQRTIELVRNFLYLLSPKRVSKTYFCEILAIAGKISPTTCKNILINLDRRIIENQGGNYFFVHESIHSALKNSAKVTLNTELKFLRILLNYFTKKYHDRHNNVKGFYDVVQNYMHVQSIYDYVKSIEPASAWRHFYQQLLGNILNDEIGSSHQAQILLSELLDELEARANSIYSAIRVNSSNVSGEEYKVLTEFLSLQRDLAFAERKLGNFTKQFELIQPLLAIITDIQRFKEGIPAKWQMQFLGLYFEFAQNLARACGDLAAIAQGDARLANAKLQIASCEEIINLQPVFPEIDQNLVKSCELTIANAHGILGDNAQQILLLENLITTYPTSENDVDILTSFANAYSTVNSTQALNYAGKVETILKNDEHTNNTCYNNYNKCLDSYRMNVVNLEDNCRLTVCAHVSIFISEAISFMQSGNLREAYLAAEKAFYLTYFINDYGPDHFYTKQAQRLYSLLKENVTVTAIECLAKPDSVSDDCSKIVTCNLKGRMYYIADPVYECSIFGIPAIGQVILRGEKNICSIGGSDSAFVYNNVLNAAGLLESVNQQNLPQYYCQLPASNWSIIAQNLFKGPLLGLVHGISDLIYLNKFEPLLEQKFKKIPSVVILCRFLIPYFIYALTLMLCDRFLFKEKSTNGIWLSFSIGFVMALLDVAYISLNNPYLKRSCAAISGTARLSLMGMQAYSLCKQDGVENTSLLLATSIHFGLLTFSRKPSRQTGSTEVRQEVSITAAKTAESKKTN